MALNNRRNWRHIENEMLEDLEVENYIDAWTVGCRAQETGTVLPLDYLNLFLIDR